MKSTMLIAIFASILIMFGTWWWRINEVEYFELPDFTIIISSILAILILTALYLSF